LRGLAAIGNELAHSSLKEPEACMKKWMERPMGKPRNARETFTAKAR